MADLFANPTGLIEFEFVEFASPPDTNGFGEGNLKALFQSIERDQI